LLADGAVNLHPGMAGVAQNMLAALRAVEFVLRHSSVYIYADCAPAPNLSFVMPTPSHVEPSLSIEISH
jgi:hypothetical protein